MSLIGAEGAEQDLAFTITHWLYAGGKGPRTATVLKANYKAALAKAAEKEAPSDDEPL